MHMTVPEDLTRTQLSTAPIHCVRAAAPEALELLISVVSIIGTLLLMIKESPGT